MPGSYIDENGKLVTGPRGAAQVAGRTPTPMGGSSQPAKPDARAEWLKQNNVYGRGTGSIHVSDPRVWDPMNNPQYSQSVRDAGIAGREGAAQYQQAAHQLSQGTATPFVQSPRAVNVSPVQAQTGRVDEATRMGYSALGAAGQSRGSQMDATELARLTAAGQGPSAAAGMANEGAARAAAAFMAAQNQAGQQYGMSANQAGLAYDQAALQSEFARRRAAEDSIRRQAALGASARGRNVGIGVRGAQNAAVEQMMRADQDAGFMRAQQQNQAAAQQAAANLQTAGMSERAGIEAGRMGEEAAARAAQLRSQEQLAAMGLYMDASGQLRSTDLNQAALANQYAQTGLAADQFVTGVGMQNADRSFAADRYNQDTALRAAQLNQAAQLQNNQLNQAGQLALAQMGQQGQQYGINAGMNAGLASTAGQTGYEQYFGNQYNAAAGRNLNQNLGQSAGNQAMLGAGISAAGTLGGAALGFMAGGPPGAVVGGAMGSQLGQASGGAANAASNQNFSGTPTSSAGTGYDPYSSYRGPF